VASSGIQTVPLRATAVSVASPVAPDEPAKKAGGPDSQDLPKATVKLQVPTSAASGGPRPASVPAPKATVPLAKAPAPVPGRGEAASAPAAMATFELDEVKDSAESVSAGGVDKWLAIAASVVALLSTVSTFLAYSVVK